MYYNMLASSKRCTCWHHAACRLWQIVEWLAGAEGGEVLIVFDECHRAKNLVPPATPAGSFTETRSTKTGLAVLALQNALPNARWVFRKRFGVDQW
jgi:hypothetical protein